ncbi:hypothetical protein AQJ43_31535 [Streptomyces avermitilis]|nr:hypothetical protein [Streptomyces avermitilis]KUN50757.1 hypothetical protein AQJ43_31535 [Streptomyces avermitilis]OOV16714.1 hypothetical protein SM007_38175 [Streptomyces avermitilis]BBJ48180.1 hypothetical protein SAVMC3_08090 [Streptomyces avermitilis]GDY79704.1 hypothetical protein SAV31267_091890 [Streptomyces avermitilis]
MRTRKIIAGLVLGTTVGLGLMAPPAQAASTASPAASSDTRGVVDIQGAQASWHFYSSHKTWVECGLRASYWHDLHPTWEAKCPEFKGTDGVKKFHLYLYY